MAVLEHVMTPSSLRTQMMTAALRGSLLVVAVTMVVVLLVVMAAVLVAVMAVVLVVVMAVVPAMAPVVSVEGGMLVQ